MTMLSLPLGLASWLGVSLSHLTGLIIPVAAIVLVGVIITTSFYFQNRRREMWHETARLALEKGQPLPPDPEEFSDAKTPDDPVNDVRAGLICFAAGAGLYLFLGALIGPAFAYIGAIPGLVGAALVLFGLGRLMFRPRPDTRRSDDHS